MVIFQDMMSHSRSISPTVSYMGGMFVESSLSKDSNRMLRIFGKKNLIGSSGNLQLPVF